jgi:hypothetical protein
MTTVKAMLIANTVATKTTNEFLESQGEVNKPMVLFMKEGTNEIVKYFDIVAKDIEDLKFMFENKFFYTSNIKSGEVNIIDGRVFYGVNPKTIKGSV